MKTEHVAITTTDNLELPALLFGPDKPSDKAVLLLHGNGDGAVFYNPVHMGALAKAITDQGISFLALNNRGAHYSKALHYADTENRNGDNRYKGGANYELIADCVHDINGAADFLKSRGYKNLAILGESTGANKICVYHARAKKNPFRAYVLASPGDDSGYYYVELGEQRFKAAIVYAKQAVKQGKPLMVMPKYTGMYPISAQSAVDIADPDEPYNTFPYYEATDKRLGTKKLFTDYRTIDMPMLVIMGEHDEFTYLGGGTRQVMKLLEKYVNPKADSTFKVVAEASHSFEGFDDTYAQDVAEWLKEKLV